MAQLFRALVAPVVDNISQIPLDGSQLSVTVSKESCSLSCPLWALNIHVVLIHTCRPNMHVHKIKIHNYFKN